MYHYTPHSLTKSLEFYDQNKFPTGEIKQCNYTIALDDVRGPLPGMFYNLIAFNCKNDINLA